MPPSKKVLDLEDNLCNALVVNKDDGKTSSGVSQITLEDLPEGEVVVAVEYSTY